MADARLHVTRDGAWYGRLRKLRVLLDGTEVGRLAGGESRTFDIAAGPHELYVQMDWVKSDPVTFNCTAGDELEAHCASPPFSFSFRDIFVFNLWERASKPFTVTLSRRDTG